MHGREELEWGGHIGPGKYLRLASGVYVDGILINASYGHSLGDGRAELSQDGSLIIHSYEDRDRNGDGTFHGGYYCRSEFRKAKISLNRFRMYILWNVDIRY